MKRHLALLGLSGMLAQAASVRGVVVDATTGKPLPGAHIRLYNQSALGKPPYGAISDAAGRFSVDPITMDHWVVSAELPGYIQAARFNVLGKRAQLTAMVTAARPSEELRIELVPKVVIRGKVLDRAGNPVKNVVVELRDETGNIIPGEGGARANGLGEYRLEAPPGKYLVRAARDNMAAWLAGGGGFSRNYVETYFPEAAVEERATVLSVKAGEVRQPVDIRMIPFQKLTISGKLTGLSPAGCQDSVLLTQKVGEQFINPKRVQTGVDRQFSFAELASGLYQLSASRGPKYSSLSREIAIGDASITGIELELSENADWIGRVEAPSNENRSRRAVRFRPPMQILEQPHEFQTDEFGNFHVSDLPPLIYAVEVVNGPYNEVVQSMTINGMEVHNPID
jgi:hypothetical protein